MHLEILLENNEGKKTLPLTGEFALAHRTIAVDQP
jgi:hypothetical protein